MLITSNLDDTDVNSSVSPELFTLFSSLNRLLNNPTVPNLNISVSYKNGKEIKGRKKEIKKGRKKEREGKKGNTSKQERKSKLQWVGNREPIYTSTYIEKEIF